MSARRWVDVVVTTLALGAISAALFPVAGWIGPAAFWAGLLFSEKVLPWLRRRRS